MKLQMVVSRFKEEVDWTKDYSSVLIYNKGKDIEIDCEILPNVGREAHTYLHHIVNKYENLAEVTCFFQGTKPSFGARDGHLCSGIEVIDYFEAPKFIYTCSISTDEKKHRTRSLYKDYNDKIKNVTTLPINSQDDYWSSFDYYDWSNNEFKKLKDSQIKSNKDYHFKDFCLNVLEIDISNFYHINYSQGAQFSVSRETIRKKPKAYYERIISYLDNHICPFETIFMEWAWGLLFDTDKAINSDT